MLIRSCDLLPLRFFRDYRQPFSACSCHMARATSAAYELLPLVTCQLVLFIFLQSSVHRTRFHKLRTQKKLSHSNKFKALDLNCNKMIFKGNFTRTLQNIPFTSRIEFLNCPRKLTTGAVLYLNFV